MEAVMAAVFGASGDMNAVIAAVFGICPVSSGHYNSRSWETGFFVSHGGNWQSEYGHFFLSWYRCVVCNPATCSQSADACFGSFDMLTLHAGQVWAKGGRPAQALKLLVTLPLLLLRLFCAAAASVGAVGCWCAMPGGCWGPQQKC